MRKLFIRPLVLVLCLSAAAQALRAQETAPNTDAAGPVPKTINEMRRNENMNEVQGLDIIDLGLGSVLFDTATGETYTPNTDTTKAAGVSDSEGAIQAQGGEANAD